MSRIKTIARNLRLLLTREITTQIGEVENRLNLRADGYERTIDARLDERFAQTEQHTDTRIATFEQLTDGRFGAFEQQADERFIAFELRTDERTVNHETTLDKRVDERLTQTELRIDRHFDERSRAVESRMDERFARTEQQIDERFEALEKRTDERLERHERKVDKMVRQMSMDIVERTDVMLQIFEQRLDKQRREVRQLRETKRSEAHPANTEETDDPSRQQLVSFRKLANVTSNVQAKVKQFGEKALYHQILDWKKVAHEGMDEFSPYEQEMVAYIHSFLDDPRELHYVNQHLRRFISTLQRIPPARQNTDRLLELGSLSHIAPAIKKYCGYGEVACADFWNSPDKISQETITQKHVTKGQSPESHTFELRNFNVERDAFPYPDNHFRVVICCELIEHLQSDPMHMLWECNRVLEPDGWLLITTPNIASCRAIEGLLVGCAPYLLAQYNVRETVDQHNREYAPYEVGVALAAAGFTVAELETEDVWARSNPAILDLLKQVQITTEMRGDNIFALARKSGAPIERYPKELYIE